MNSINVGYKKNCHLVISIYRIGLKYQYSSQITCFRRKFTTLIHLWVLGSDLDSTVHFLSPQYTCILYILITEIKI